MRSGAGGPEQQEWGERDQGDPADLRRRRRHARQHQRRGGRQERAEQGQRGQAARIPGLAGGAGDLRQGELRVSGAGRRRDRSDHRRARRAEDRSAAALRDRRAPQARRASSSTRSASTRRCERRGGGLRLDDRSPPTTHGPGAACARPVPHVWWLAASARHRRARARCRSAASSISPRAAPAIVWPHLVANVLPHAHAHDGAAARSASARWSPSIGVGTAWLVTMFRFPGRRIFEWALLLPLAVPTYIVAYAYLDVLHPIGPVQTTLRELLGIARPRDLWFPEIRSLGGCIFLLGIVLYPYVYLPVRALFLMQSAATLEVARTLGAGPLRRLLPRRAAAGAAGHRGRRQPRADGGAERHRRLGVSRRPHADRRDLHDLDGAHERGGRGADRARHARRRLRADPARALGAPAAALCGARRAGTITPTPQPLARLAARGARCSPASLPILFGFLVPASYLVVASWRRYRLAGLPDALPDWIGNSAALRRHRDRRRGPRRPGPRLFRAPVAQPAPRRSLVRARPHRLRGPRHGARRRPARAARLARQCASTPSCAPPSASRPACS